jgi:NAD(P)-dependent dehydrogenase (short-subunit alcohol dehydrogenase family)
MKKTALITGSSSGIGLVTAVEMARDFQVVATMRNPAGAENLLRAAEQAGVKDSLEVMALDITKPESIASCVAAVIAKYGRIDVVVNNAGFALGGFAEDISEIELKRQFETNFFGHVAMTKAVLPQMRAQKGGHIIMVSSISGLVAYPVTSSYAASKHALEGWSESLRIELHPLGIRVVLIEPGAFQSDIWEKNVQIGQKAMSPDSNYAEKARKYAGRVKETASRRDDPRKVARLIARVARMENPRLRYRIGKDAAFFYWFKKALPWRTYEKLIIKGTKTG